MMRWPKDWNAAQKPGFRITWYLRNLGLKISDDDIVAATLQRTLTDPY
jgi:hypothetical protein